jgi:hypothetical protein
VTRRPWARPLRTGGLLALVLLLGAGCAFLRSPDLTEPDSVPPGFSAVPAGGCGVAFPAGWKRDVLAEGQLLYEGAAGRGSLHVFAEDEAARPDEPLPEFVSFHARTPVRVTSRQPATVPGAEAAFRLRLAGADGSTHLAVYGHDAQEGRGCWMLVSPADRTAETAARTLTLAGG